MVSEVIIWMKCDDCKYSDITRKELGMHRIYYDEIYCNKKEKKIVAGFFDYTEIIKCVDYEKQTNNK